MVEVKENQTRASEALRGVLTRFVQQKAEFV